MIVTISWEQAGLCNLPFAKQRGIEKLRELRTVSVASISAPLASSAFTHSSLPLLSIAQCSGLFSFCALGHEYT